MYIKLDPRSPFDNFVIEPPTSSSSLLQWRMVISRKRRSKGKNTHTLSLTQDIRQRWETGEKIEQRFKEEKWEND